MSAKRQTLPRTRGAPSARHRRRRRGRHAIHSSPTAISTASTATTRTEIASVFYSLLETAKLASVDPAKYLREAALASGSGQLLLPSDMCAGT
jgi:hypothetical protein